MKKAMMTIMVTLVLTGCASLGGITKSEDAVNFSAMRMIDLSEPVLEFWIRPDNKAESGSKAEHICNM